MEIDSELLKDLGKKQGLKNKEHIEKSWMQDHLLYYLSKKKDNLVFKGGTALYKFYSLPRFSEDLDFSTKNLVDQDLIEEFCKTHRCTFNYKKVHDSNLYKLKLQGVLTKANTLRVDINVTTSIYTSEIKTYISPYPDIPPFLVKTMSLKEILAEKIHSVLNRTKARDLYDIFFILRIIDITKENKELIIKKLHDREIMIQEKDLLEQLTKRTKALSNLWTEELKHFILQELPDFKIVRDFVLKKFE